MKRLALASFLAACAFASAYGQTDDEKNAKKLIALTREISNASKYNDRAALERLLAEEFFMTLPDGRTFDRKRTIDFWTNASPGVTNEDFEIADARAVVSGDTAIVTAVVTDYWRENGVEKIHLERVFDAWQRRKGKWRLLASKPNRIDERNGK